MVMANKNVVTRYLLIVTRDCTKSFNGVYPELKPVLSVVEVKGLG